ncbi:dethiobiotin synthetase [Aeromicrobium panaciterrae]|uniref:ATP-dependent dethiobiotin synthetase BioD n=1 Tax=Aeromicrobium panaciterrae TaxID=363861 RepID=A0ABU1UKH7_9ACTN|nr:dethiobiotin synthase [Aeromicrobium panaciterrae]MDR7085697.1 dethiobiotin synthetase [Aeromicrobium panaciterrae]
MTFPNSKFVVVTGTDTGVGKTVATAALLVALGERGLSVAVAKPVQTGIATGEPTDLEEVARLTGSTAIHEFTRLTPPLAPVAAARIDKVDLPPLDTYVDGIREIEADVVLIEGAGGLLVHLDGGERTILDLATDLEADVVVVGSEGLGSLNHFALTVKVLGQAGIEPVLVIGSCAAEPDLASISNLTDLPQVTGLPTTGRIPAAAGVLPIGDFRAQAPSWFTFT